MPSEPTGFLAVWANPGPTDTAVPGSDAKHPSPEEFSDWYDNEHVPLRTALPNFYSAARFKALPGPASALPTAAHREWLALYDVSSTAVFSDPSYAILRANRSAREAGVVGRTALLDRRMYSFLAAVGAEGPLGFGELAVGKAGPSELGNARVFERARGGVVTQGIDADGDDAVKAWLSQVGDAANGVEGWIRTRLFKHFEAARNSYNRPKEEAPFHFPGYLVVHEFTTPKSSQEAEADASLQGILRVTSTGVQYAAGEDTFFETYKVWEASGKPGNDS